jgi:hypothetical protein
MGKDRKGETAMNDPRSGATEARPAIIGLVGALCLSLVVALAASAASAGVILDVSGPPNSGEVLSAHEAAAAAFSLAATVSNVTITAPVSCISCQGGIWLQRNSIGSGASFGDSVFAEAFPSTMSITLSSLAAGTYFMIFSVDTGSLVWQGSDPTTVTGNGGSALNDWLATSTDPFAPKSDFSVVFGVGLNFTITSTPIPPAAPEPGSLALLATALGALGIAAYHQKATVASR